MDTGNLAAGDPAALRRCDSFAVWPAPFARQGDPKTATSTIVNHVSQAPPRERALRAPSWRARCGTVSSVDGPRGSLTGAETFCASDAEAGAGERGVRDVELSRKVQAPRCLAGRRHDLASECIETLLVRALEQLKTMEERNRVLGARRSACCAPAKQKNG